MYKLIASTDNYSIKFSDKANSPIVMFSKSHPIVRLTSFFNNLTHGTDFYGNVIELTIKSDTSENTMFLPNSTPKQFQHLLKLCEFVDSGESITYNCPPKPRKPKLAPVQTQPKPQSQPQEPDQSEPEVAAPNSSSLWQKVYDCLSFLRASATLANPRPTTESPMTIINSEFTPVPLNLAAPETKPAHQDSEDFPITFTCGTEMLEWPNVEDFVGFYAMCDFLGLDKDLSTSLTTPIIDHANSAYEKTNTALRDPRVGTFLTAATIRTREEVDVLITHFDELVELQTIKFNGIDNYHYFMGQLKASGHTLPYGFKIDLTLLSKDSIPDNFNYQPLNKLTIVPSSNLHTTFIQQAILAGVTTLEMPDHHLSEPDTTEGPHYAQTAPFTLSVATVPPALAKFALEAGVKSLALTGNLSDITIPENADFSRLRSLDLSKAKFSPPWLVDRALKSGLTSLTLSGYDGSTIELSDDINLSKLANLTLSKAYNIPLPLIQRAFEPGLKSLDMSSLNFANIVVPEEIDFKTLETLNLAEATNVPKELVAHALKAGLTSLDLSEFDFTNFEWPNDANFSQLKTLKLDDAMHIPQALIDLAANSNLTELSLKTCNLRHIKLSSNNLFLQLESLNLDSSTSIPNKLVEIGLTRNLNFLGLSCFNFRQLPLPENLNFSRMEHLILAGAHHIPLVLIDTIFQSDINYFDLSGCDLNGLRNLKKASISSVDHLDLSAARNIQPSFIASVLQADINALSLQSCNLQNVSFRDLDGLSQLSYLNILNARGDHFVLEHMCESGIKRVIK